MSKRLSVGWEKDDSYPQYIKNSPLEKWTRNINRHFTVDEI